MQHLLVVVLALAAGFGGAYAFDQMDASTGETSAAEGTGDVALLREQVADLERALHDIQHPPATLSASASPSGAADQDAIVEAVLAKVGGQVDERVDKRVDERVDGKLSSLKEEGDSRPGRRFGRGKKRVSLREAADALELSSQQEDELHRIYDDSMNRFLKLAAGEDGDVEDVKRDLAEAQKNPAQGRMRLMKYAPNMMKNVAELMTIQAEREQAVIKAVGPDKARRLQNEFDVKEANPFGMGGSVRIESRMDTGDK